MELNEIRRIMNNRVTVFYMDKSDIDFTIKAWLLFYMFSNFFNALIIDNILDGIGLQNNNIGVYIVLFSLVSIFPAAVLIKMLKTGKNKGHLEFLFYRLINLREGIKSKKIFIYNLRKSGFIYKTMFYLTKKV